MHGPARSDIAAKQPALGRKPLIEHVTLPLNRLMQAGPAGGIALLLCAVVALAWANSPWAGAYHELLETPMFVGVGGVTGSLTLHNVVNDGLMAVFFFLVGLEIKREFLVGELATARKAALPLVAAFGGMVVPALFFVAFNFSHHSARGWGVPMATDIAFALGVLALVGDRIPASLRVFLSALAIADDLGAVLVIALFYTATISWTAIAAAAAMLLLSIVANAVGIRATWAYALIGIALWVAVLLSGVHATVAGVLLAMTIPSRTRIDEAAFLNGARDAIAQFHDAHAPERTVLSSRVHQDALEQLNTLTDHAQSPLIRLEHGLNGIVTFGIMPLFAIANAGVSLHGSSHLLMTPVALGVLAGLFLGKPLGIVLASWIAIKSGMATLASDVTHRMLIGIACLGGIGFTMSLFIAALAFGGSEELLTAAKLGTFAASLLAGIVGWVILRTAPASAVSGRIV